MFAALGSGAAPKDGPGPLPLFLVPQEARPQCWFCTSQQLRASYRHFKGDFSKVMLTTW